MKSRAGLKSWALLFMSTCLASPSAIAAERTPVQACAIIHAVFEAKKAITEDKAAATYCRKFVPSKPVANEKLRTKLSVSTAKRQSSLGRSANKKVAKLDNGNGASSCDPDIQGTFNKNEAVDPAVVAAYIDQQFELCDERN